LIKLIIFDCDGVLIDSEIIYHKVGAREMTRIGFPLTVARSIELFSGVADESAAEVIRKEYGRTIANNDFEMILKKIKDSFPTNLQPIANILQVIHYLDQQGIAKCIASNSTYDYIITALKLVNMETFFDTKCIFSASMVEQKKPAPDIFLFAAKQMGFKSTDCLVIEDSVVGVQAALAADMQVIGFLGGEHAKNDWYKAWLEAYGVPIAHNSEELLHLLMERLHV
jgi:HAD superfamily hydrolase (TIGR01509 family)